ncbi:MAG: hypothetical protein HQL97_00270 [Magnetococcales bacterium]|nr:hypothetical protein [Magnetococcales bacterium]
MDAIKSAERMKFTRIKGDYSEVRRLPRLGKIRLGVKRQTQGGKQYPSETEHFVCPSEVEAVYGPTPTELDVMLPLEDPEQVLVQKFARYGASAGLKCHGNGEQAEQLNEQTKQWEPRTCPCPALKSEKNPKGDCTPQTHLLVLLPKVSMGGCYQITTRSFHSTVGLNSSLDYTRGLAGRIALLPMKLRRVPQETHHDGKKQVHYILSLVLDATLPQIADIRSNPESLLIPSRYQIEGPQDENPLMDPVDIIDAPLSIEASDLADMSDEKMEEIQAKLNATMATNTLPAAEPLKAQTTIVDPAEKKPDPPKAEPPKAAAPAPSRTWTESVWVDICLYFADSPQLVELRDHILRGMKYVNKQTGQLNDLRQINAIGRDVFMRRVAIEAERRNITLGVK